MESGRSGSCASTHVAELIDFASARCHDVAIRSDGPTKPRYRCRYSRNGAVFRGEADCDRWMK